MTARSRIFVMPRAKDEILHIARWWNEERPRARDLFRREPRAAKALLRAFANCGRRCDAPGFAAVRRLLLRRTRYYLYYRWDEGAQLLIVLAIRHASRGPTGDAPT